jgi:hypothetical protein
MGAAAKERKTGCLNTGPWRSPRINWGNPMEEPEPGNKEMLGTPIAEYRNEIVALDVLVGFILFAGWD